MVKKGRTLSYAEQRALDILTGLGRDTVQDWTAQHDVDWAALVGAIVAADAGVMLRAADQGRAVAVGVFLGGPGAWQTCRDVSELSSYLNAALVTLQELAGKRTAPEPTKKGRAAARKV